MRIIKDSEYFLTRNVEDEKSKNDIRTRMMGTKNNFVKRRKRYSNDAIDTTLNNYMSTISSFLKENQNLVVARADKGSAIVIMYKTKYEDAISTMLGDGTTYRKLK